MSPDAGRRGEVNRYKGKGEWVELGIDNVKNKKGEKLHKKFV